MTRTSFVQPTPVEYKISLCDDINSMLVMYTVARSLEQKPLLGAAAVYWQLELFHGFLGIIFYQQLIRRLIDTTQFSQYKDYVDDLIKTVSIMVSSSYFQGHKITSQEWFMILVITFVGV